MLVPWCAVALVLAAPSVDDETILVLDLEHSADVGADLAKTVTSLIVTEVGRRTPHRVLSGADLRSMTALEGERQAYGCADDTSCLAEVASALGAQHVISGRLASLGAELVLQLSLLDVGKALPIAREQVRAANVGALADALPALVGALLTPLGATAPVVAASPPAASGDAPVDDEGPSFLAWGLGVGGGMVALAAVAGVIATGALGALAFTDMATSVDDAKNRGDARVVFFAATGAGAIAVVALAVGAAGLVGAFFVE